MRLLVKPGETTTAIEIIMQYNNIINVSYFIYISVDRKNRIIQYEFAHINKNNTCDSAVNIFF